jgi:hypothetical protein
MSSHTHVNPTQMIAINMIDHGSSTKYSIHSNPVGVTTREIVSSKKDQFI